MDDEGRFEYIRRHGEAPPDEPPEVQERTAEPNSASWMIRVEALRAASQIVAGLKLQVVYSDQDTEALAMRVAKRFERYLEGGE